MMTEVASVLLSNPRYLVYLSIWFIWTLIQDSLLRILNIFLPVNNNNKFPVKVYKVLLRRKFLDVDMSSPQNFLMLYWGNTSLEYLKRHTVSQYCVYDQHVYFVDTDPGVNIYSSDTSPFAYIAQWTHATHMLAVPFDEFLKFAQDLDEPQVKVILLSNTGRCGSTLLTQMLEEAGSTQSISEPDILTGLQVCHNKHTLSYDQIGKLLSASFQVYAHMAQQHGDYRVVIMKTRSVCNSLVPLIHKYVPWVHHLYLYRQGIRTVASMYSAYSDAPGMKQIMYDREKVLQFAKVIGLELRGPIDKIKDYFSMMTITWAMSLSNFQDFRFQQKIPIHCVRYEDLVKQPREHIEAINKQYFLGYGEKQINNALQALQRDSQRGISIGKNNNKEVKDDDFNKLYTVERKLNSDDICKELGVPLLDSNDAIPGALPLGPQIYNQV